MDLGALQREFEKHRDRWVGEWMTLLRFPSISADPARAGDCRQCAEWLNERLVRLGFRSEVCETPTLPVVFGERDGLAGPVALFYGHYDVQPVDPLELWTSPPFEPVLRDGRVYARGAEDNKGQLFYVLSAMETLISAGVPLPRLKVVLEGEEESGSRGIGAFLDARREQLAADVLMVADSETVSTGAPTIVMGLRGVVHLTARLSGPVRDLHSGIHGGRAPNPAQAMARLVASLHGPDGRIAVPDYYRDVAPASERERELLRGVPFDSAQFEAQTGVPPVAGEREYSPPERVGFRPSIDLNGIHSGYGGEGMKTIIPSCAMAKITARVVPGQDPAWCLSAIAEHLRRNAPEGLRLQITEQAVGGPGFRLNPDSDLVIRARRVLDRLTGEPTAFLWEGASIPVVAALADVSGAEPLLVGFGHEEDSVHAPNESFSLEQFRLGFLYAGSFLAAMGSESRSGSRR